MLEAYKIGVTLALNDQVTNGLHAIAGTFEKTADAVKGLQERLEHIKDAAKNSGGGLIEAGKGMLEMLKAPVDEIGKMDSELGKLRALNFGGAIDKQAEQFAKSVHFMGLSASDNMKLVRESVAAMDGDVSQAKKMVPLLAQMKFGIDGGMGDGQGSKFDDMLESVLQTAEMRGALKDEKTGKLDTGKFKGVLDMMVKSYVASDGKVKPQDYLDALKSGDISTKMMSNEMFFMGLGHFIEKSGGTATGAGSLEMFKEFGLGKMSQEMAEGLVKNHLLDQSAVHYKDGKYTDVDPNGIKGSKDAAENPFKWINEVVVPELKKQGFEGNALDMQLSNITGVKSKDNLAGQFLQDQKLAEQYIARAKQAAGSEQLAGLAGDSSGGKRIELQAQWNTLMGELGEQILPIAVEVLSMVNPLVKGLTEWIKDSPTTVKILAGAFVALASSLMITGAIGVGLTVGKNLSLISGIMIRMAGPLRALSFAMAMSDVGGAKGIASLAGSLGSVAGQLKMVGAAALVFASYELGKLGGALIYENMSEKNQDKVGGTIATVLSWFGDEEAKEALAKNLGPKVDANQLSKMGAMQAKAKHPTTSPAPPKTYAPEMPRKKPVGPVKDEPAPAVQEMLDKINRDIDKAANISVSVFVDSKEIASHLVTSNSTGATGYNTAANRPSPSASYHGLGG